MSFQIKTSNNSLKAHKNFKSIAEFMKFYRNVLSDEIKLYHVPLKISTQRISDIIQGSIIFMTKVAINAISS